MDQADPDNRLLARLLHCVAPTICDYCLYRAFLRLDKFVLYMLCRAEVYRESSCLLP